MINLSTNALDVLRVRVFYKWPNLVYTKDYQSIPPDSPTLAAPVLFPNLTRLARHPNISTENLDPGTCFHLGLFFFNKVSCQNFTSSLTIFDAVTIAHCSNSTRLSFSSPITMAKRAPYSVLIKVNNFPYQNTSCNSVLTMKLLLMPLVVMPLQ